jgi:hypothetical protein
MIDRLNMFDQLIAKDGTIIGQDAQGKPITFTYPENELGNIKTAREQVMQSLSAYTNASGNASFQSQEVENGQHPDFQRRVLQDLAESRLKQIGGNGANTGVSNWVQPIGDQKAWTQKVVSDTYNNANNDETINTETKNYLSYDPRYAKATPEGKIAMEEKVRHQIATHKIMGMMGHDGNELMVKNPTVYQYLTDTINAMMGGSSAQAVPAQAVPVSVPYRTAEPYSPQAVLPQMFRVPMSNGVVPVPVANRLLIPSSVPYTNTGPYFHPDRLPQMFRVPMSNNAGTGGRLNILNYKQ